MNTKGKNNVEDMQAATITTSPQVSALIQNMFAKFSDKPANNQYEFKKSTLAQNGFVALTTTAVDVDEANHEKLMKQCQAFWAAFTAKEPQALIVLTDSNSTQSIHLEITDYENFSCWLLDPELKNEEFYYLPKAGDLSSKN